MVDAVLDLSMFAQFFDLLRNNAGPVITFYLKVLVLVTGVVSILGVVRHMVIVAVEGSSPSGSSSSGSFGPALPAHEQKLLR